jgi:hypothetical protein
MTTDGGQANADGKGSDHVDCRNGSLSIWMIAGTKYVQLPAD